MSASATAVPDLDPHIPDACYQLDGLDGSAVVSRSVDLCITGVQTDGTLNPLTLSVGLDAQPRPVLRWLPNGDVGFYAVVENGERHLLAGNSTSFVGPSPVTTPTCLLLVEYDPGATILSGYGPRMCIFASPVMP